MKPYTLCFADGREMALGRRTRIMGVVNITPDSFSDGGRFFDPDAAVAQAEQMVKAGADILDIGGESTRPFSRGVSAEEEMERVIPVIAGLAQTVSVPISVDTTKAAVAKAALDAGAAIINDVSALQGDPEMGPLAARRGVPVVLMHMKGTPETMQQDPQYGDLFGEIHGFFEQAIARAQEAGIPRSGIVLDPGIGFGKTVTHNLLLIRHLFAFADLDCPLLLGSSRKAFIRKILGEAAGGAEFAPRSRETEIGTQATVTAAVLGGAHIVRVHDVAGTWPTVRIADALKTARETP